MVGVVLIHTFGYYLLDPDAAGSSRWWAAVYPRMLAQVAVPVFVIVSGALLLERRGYGWRAFYRRRLVRVGIPTLVWHVVYFGYGWLALDGRDVSDALEAALQGRLSTGLYFLWIILGLYAVTPLLWPLVERLGPRRTLVAGVLLTVLAEVDAAVQALVGPAQGTSAVSGRVTSMFVPYLGYFLLGHGLGRPDLPTRIAGLPTRWLAPSVVALGAIALSAQVGWAREPAVRAYSAVGPFGYHSLVIAVMAVATVATARLWWRPVPGWQRIAGPDLSFAVFCVHILVVRLVLLAKPWWRTPSSPDQTVQLFLVVLVLSAVAATVLVRVPVLRAAVGVARPHRPAGRATTFPIRPRSNSDDHHLAGS
jgi:surface polysaccharide O-acyltransferase-like enzyme